MTFAMFGFSNVALGQFGGLKDKVKNKVEKKTEDAVDKKIDEATEKSDDENKEAKEAEEGEPAAEGSEAEKPAASAATGATATSEDMSLYTKYDFVPGDKIVFFDDLSREEMGEFPSRWNLDNGVFEIAKQYGQNWIMCSDEGSIRPRVELGALPPKYTVEMDFYNKGGESKGHWFHIEWMDAEDVAIGILRLQDAKHTNLRIKDKDVASKDLQNILSAGKHTMRVMATKSTIKCYIDNERIANVPAVDGLAPIGFRIHLDPWTDDAANPMLMGSFRYAEGGKTMREQLDEAGKIVTHGILFDSGSDKIKAESYKTLADIGQLLTDDPALKLSIEGHTDSDGADESNADLSLRRASSVKAYLSTTFKTDDARLSTKGWGESKPIDTNDTPEGKANNRRVELVKL
jgi:outer membrane protein OmpA-like peptidoglycan-associated protein